MARMLPDVDFDVDFEEEEKTNVTYGLDFENKVIKGKIDDDEALIQAIHKVCITPKEKYPVYGAYGVDTDEMFGANTSVAASLICSNIQDAILADDRFESVTFDSIKRTDKHTLSIELTVTKADGTELSTEEEVNV